MLITGIDDKLSKLNENDVFTVGNVVVTVKMVGGNKALSFELSGNATMSGTIPTSAMVPVTLDGELLAYVDTSKKVISGLTPNTGYLADKKTDNSLSLTADKDGKYTFSNVGDGRALHRL